MKERLISAIRIILMLGVCMAGITLMYKIESNTRTPTPEIIQSEDTTDYISFYDKSAKEGLREALEFFNIEHPDIVYAQAVLETGNFRSAVCKEHNNLFGLYNSKSRDYYRFNHWVESVVAYRDWIQRRYDPPNDYYMFLERINYAEDSLYTHKLKQIVRKENDKRRYAERDSLS